jgi:fido (protein-threonine AMPylation protein)
MPEYKYKVYVNARFEVLWQKLLDKIIHPEKYVEGISNVEMLENDSDHYLRITRFNNKNWQELKELIVADKTTGFIVYRLVDHPFFQGETINICRTTNQVYQSELEYQINWKLKDQNNQESNQDKDLTQQALQLAVNEMKRISEEAEAVYN